MAHWIRSGQRNAWGILIGIGIAVGFPVPVATGAVHLAVQAAEPATFRDYFWVNREFGGLLGDFIPLADGTHAIEVFGPPGPPTSPRSGMFYTLTVSVQVAAARPAIRSVEFDSYCIHDGIANHVTAWPPPTLVGEERFPGAFRLVIGNPIVAKRDTPCTPLSPPSMASWANLGALKLIATSTPPGAEVWVLGSRVGQTNSTINVPYRDSTQKIDVVIRMPGYVNCRWVLAGPFDAEARVNCEGKTP
jgi:hypothetical protein